MSSGDSVIFCFLLVISHVAGLVKLPNVDDNNILTAEAVIRDTVNTLFSSLRLKDVKKKPRLKEYSTVHNHLISFTLQDYNNLKEIAKLTKVVKNETNVDINNFMTALNDLLNEDSTENTEFTLNSKEEILVNYIEDFLHQLEVLKFKHGVKHDDFRLKKDISRILKKGDSLFFNDTSPEAKSNASVDKDNLLDDEGFWKPDNISSGRRIYRGNRVKIRHFPFVTSIHIFNNFQCAGSIITADLIVTAASCLQLAYNNRMFRENPAFLSVRVGSDFYNGGEHIAALEVYFHPLYSPKNLNNNICVIRLTRRLMFSKKRRNVKKIEFDKEATMLPEVSDGITVVGWGAQGAASSVMNPWKNRLAYAVLDYYPLMDCQEIYSKDFVTKKNFCAGFFSKGGGACNRDVGGPGVVNGILAGIISFGSPICGSANSPTVFTKLGYYTDWIERIMEQDAVPVKRQRTTTLKAKMVSIPYFGRTITSFKITPPSGDISPIPIREIDSLRTLNRTDLFREFIITMFDSKERKEYADILNPNMPDDDQQEEVTTSFYPPSRKRPHKPQPVTPIYSNIPIAIVDYDPKVPSNDIPGMYEGDSIERNTVKPTNRDPRFYDIEDSSERNTIIPTTSDPYDIRDSLERNTIKPTNDVPDIAESLERNTIKPTRDVPEVPDIGDSLERNTIKPTSDVPELSDIGDSVEKFSLIPEKDDFKPNDFERSTTEPTKDDPELYDIEDSKDTIKPTQSVTGPYDIGDSLEIYTSKPTHSVTGPYDIGDSLEKNTVKPTHSVTEPYDIGDSLERNTVKPTHSVIEPYDIGDSLERNTIKPTHSVTEPYDIGDSLERNTVKPTHSVTEPYDIGDSLERNTVKPTHSVTEPYDIGDSLERNTIKPTHSVTEPYDIGDSLERNTIKPTHSANGPYDIGDSLERNTIKPADGDFDIDDSIERSTTKPTKIDPKYYDLEDDSERNTYKPTHSDTGNYDSGDSTERNTIKTTHIFTGNHYIDDSLERDTFKPSKPSKQSKPSKPSKTSKPFKPSKHTKPYKTLNPFKPVRPVNHDDPITISYDIEDSSERNTMKPPHFGPNNGKIDHSKIKPDEICSDETDVELIRMLDNIDVDKIIDNISNLDDSNMVVDPKILELFQNDDDEKISNIDESIMTLLYLSKAEKDLLNDHHAKKQDYMNEGMSIPFKDLTYRNNFLTRK